jgi:geranylgeranyl pyrophosphate synthase
MEDLIAEKASRTTPEVLEFIHLSKTAAMIEASLAMGGLCAGAPEADVATLREAGRELGLAFQIVDDILDATSDTATLGKTAGKDARAGKATYVSVHGIEAARRLARERSESAVSALRRLPGATGFLASLAENLLGRSH